MVKRPFITVLAAIGNLLLAGCGTSNTIDGHQVRGTASPQAETPVEKAAREFWQEVGDKVAKAYQDDPQVQAEVEKLRRAEEDPGNLHAGAPQWFRDGWARYLRDADGRYAVLAVDRNARGWGYVFCRAADCHRLEGSQHRSFKDLRYRQKALELCRGNVRDYQPAHRPDCAIYAVKDKIVWEGRLPWK